MWESVLIIYHMLSLGSNPGLQPWYQVSFSVESYHWPIISIFLLKATSLLKLFLYCGLLKYPLNGGNLANYLWMLSLLCSFVISKIFLIVIPEILSLSTLFLCIFVEYFALFCPYIFMSMTICFNVNHYELLCYKFLCIGISVQGLIFSWLDRHWSSGSFLLYFMRNCQTIVLWPHHKYCTHTLLTEVFCPA